ncbi:MAG: ABC transporter permease [Betaproteobacteria bacterium]|nr:ABC transporter permease [Betaproteobacteria bacterium]
MREKNFVESFTKHRLGMIGLAGIVIVIALGAFGPLIVTYPVGYNEATPLAAPDREHWLGTDGLGLGLIAEIVWGARTSLFISFTAVAVATCIGVPLGLVSGYFKGRIGGLIDSVIEIAMTIPALPLMILISAISGPSMGTVAVVIGLFSWPTLSRIVRNSTLKLASMPFIEAAIVLGIPTRTIMFKHILLNAAGPALVDLTIIMATAVLTEAGLSYLGLGDPNAWSWGGILQNAFRAGQHFHAWWLIVFPSLAIMFFVVSFNLLGLGINETLNPKRD